MTTSRAAKLTKPSSRLRGVLLTARLNGEQAPAGTSFEWLRGTVAFPEVRCADPKCRQRIADVEVRAGAFVISADRLTGERSPEGKPYTEAVTYGASLASDQPFTLTVDCGSCRRRVTITDAHVAEIICAGRWLAI